MAHRFELSSELRSAPDLVWKWVERPALFLHVAAPLVAIAPLGIGRFPDTWGQTEYRGTMRLFGVLPIGWQAIVIDFPEQEGTTRVLRDRGYGPLLRKWEHRIEVSPTNGGTLYADRIKFDAGALTPLAAPVVKLFFLHRQRRLRALDRNSFAALKG